MVFFILIAISMILSNCETILSDNRKTRLMQQNLSSYPAGYTQEGNAARLYLPQYFVHYLNHHKVPVEKFSSFWLKGCFNNAYNGDPIRGELIKTEKVDKYAHKLYILVSTRGKKIDKLMTYGERYRGNRILMIIKDGQYTLRCLETTLKDGHGWGYK